LREAVDDGAGNGYDPAMSNGQGSAGNVIAAVCSFFIPGLGQLVQGRVLAALFQFILTGLIWFLSFGTLGWIGHIISCVDAARWKAK
jgi:TM2 domain-containing membrane protein YozV